MSDAEDVSDVENNDEFDDFELPADSDTEEAAPGGEDEDDNPAEKEDGEKDEEELLPAPPPEGRRKPRRDRPEPSDGTRRIIVIAPEDRRSSNVMTRAEVTRAIAIRAQQISTHTHVYTPVGDLSDAISIATKELFDRRSPLMLERIVERTPAGEKCIEVWAVRKMAYPNLK